MLYCVSTGGKQGQFRPGEFQKTQNWERSCNEPRGHQYQQRSYDSEPRGRQYQEGMIYVSHAPQQHHQYYGNPPLHQSMSYDQPRYTTREPQYERTVSYEHQGQGMLLFVSKQMFSNSRDLYSTAIIVCNQDFSNS